MTETQGIATMLMFAGQAKEAIGFYTSLFDDSSLEFVEYYGPKYPGPGGRIVHARFRLKGQLFMAMDSHVKQPYTFNPSISFFVNCRDEPEIDRLFSALSESGRVIMALGNYPFATRYGWVEDRFGVSWQLMLA